MPREDSWRPDSHFDNLRHIDGVSFWVYTAVADYLWLFNLSLPFLIGTAGFLGGVGTKCADLLRRCFVFSAIPERCIGSLAAFFALLRFAARLGA